MFKIVRIIARLNIGGPAKNTVLLTEGLSHSAERIAHSDEWETVLVCGEVGEDEGDMMYLAKEKGIEPIVVKELGRKLSIINDWIAFWKIYKIICREKPDIVHTHTAKAGALGRLAGILYNLTCFKRHRAERRAHSVILVHTFHGHVLHSYFGRLKTVFFIWLERILALFTDRIIVVSESLKKELVEKFRIALKKKFSVRELGFELGDLLKLPVRNNSDYINIGIIGRLVPVKNHKMLFNVAKRIAHSAERRADKVKFIIIGDGELRHSLQDYARELEIQDIVEFRGWIKDLSEIYSELDIVTLTSLNEGTPVSIIEAMAAGRPVVATRVGGVSDVVQDGKTGYIAELNDDNIFADRLLDLVKDSEKRRQFGQSGREAVGRRFSKQKLVDETKTLYKSLLEKHV